MKGGNSCTWFAYYETAISKSKKEENVLRTFFTWKKHICASSNKRQEHV